MPLLWHKHQTSFHSINIPSEWGHFSYGLSYNRLIVSIQLISPASGDPIRLDWLSIITAVSIQLISPASGDDTMKEGNLKLVDSFHSINIPSEWGQEKRKDCELYNICFHSINIPSEWGRARTLQDSCNANFIHVSIQLISPASGDY